MASALIALAAFAVGITIAKDRVEVVILALVGGITWSVLMIAALPRMAKKVPPPLRVQSDELPPKASLATALIPSIALFAIADAAILWMSLSSGRPGSAATGLGIMLGGPIVLWGSLRNSRRTERELGGTLWSSPKFAWTSKSRVRYLVPTS